MNQIVIIRFSSLGDVILATSVIDAVRRLWPESRLTFVVKEEYSGALDNNPYVDRVIAVGTRDRGLRSIAALGRRLSGEGIELVVDLQGGPRGRLLASAIGARRVVRVRSRRLRRMLMTARPSLWRRDLPHVVERYLESLGPLAGERAVTGQPAVYLTPEERASALETVERVEGTGLVALAPGAKWTEKRWPAQYFANLGRALVGDNFGVLLLGSSEEQALLEEVASGISRGDSVMVLAGELRRLASVYSISAAAVCNDSGLMHLAAAVGTPTVALFGPTAPQLGFTPYGDCNKTLWLGLDCSPCSLHGDKPCRRREGPLCMNLLEPHQVLAALRQFLAQVPEEQGTASKRGGKV